MTKLATDKNAFAAILAGGAGTRMGNPDKPKQFFMLGSKPVLAHTIEKFCVSAAFDKVLVLCPEQWLRQTNDLVQRFCSPYTENILVTAGGITRNDTVMNAVNAIEEQYLVDEETVIVTHDAVRPFVSHRIIQENLDAVKSCYACDTVIPATDTIVESLDGNTISSIPKRSDLYQGQTPQSFNLLKLKKLMTSLSEDEKAILTDACKIFVLRGQEVRLVMGDPTNMKITYPQDMRLAQALLGE